MPGKIDIEETRSELTSFLDDLSSLVDQMKSDNEKGQVCSDYGDFMRASPAGFLARARERMDKKTYKIAVAGAFSSGKSTLVNALLGEPDILPADVGECTMSITLVTAPNKNEGEQVKVKYFAREEALKYVFNNPRYKVLLNESLSEVMTPSFNEDRAIEAIKKGAKKAASDPNQREKEGELNEFVKALDNYRERLGTIWPDDIKNAEQYLTVNDQREGMGHLLLIEQVEVHKDNALFTQDGFEIIDLPGTDSTNDRQRELTHGYLAEADAVLNIIEPKGIAEAGARIFEEMGKHNNEVRNKMFFVMNKFDMIQLVDLSPEKIDKLIKHGVLRQLIDFGLDTDKFYVTSAIYQDMQNRKDLGAITSNEYKVFESIVTDCTTKLHTIEQDKNRFDPSIFELMEICYKDGGVMNFKKRLMEYLQYDIQVERLNEINTDLNRVYVALRAMLAVDEGKIQQLVQEQQSVGEQIAEFFEKTEKVFKKSVRSISKKVPQIIPDKLGQLRARLEQVLAAKIDDFDIDDILEQMNVHIPRDIKVQTINQLLGMLPDKFADTVKALPRELVGVLKERIESSQVGEVLRKLSEDLNQPWHDEFQMILQQFESNIEEFTYMRTLEETWTLVDTPAQVQASPQEQRWTQEIEEQFREELKKHLVNAFLSFAKELSKNLVRHYEFMMKRLIVNFGDVTERARQFIRRDPERVTLPLELLQGSDGQDSEEVRVGRALMNYQRTFDDLSKQHKRIAPMLKGRA